MKRNLLLCLLVLPLLFNSGCVAPQAGGETPMLIQDAADIANTATWIGASYDLDRHPERRILYAAAYEGLNSLIRDENYTPSELADVLKNLPVSEFTGSKGTLVVGGIVTLWNRASRRIDINRVELVRAVAPAIRDGLKSALQLE